jgi:hypothetical protein
LTGERCEVVVDRLHDERGAFLELLGEESALPNLRLEAGGLTVCSAAWSVKATTLRLRRGARGHQRVTSSM